MPQISKPINAILHNSPLGRQFYLSGIDGDTYIIRFMDNGEIKRITHSQYIKSIQTQQDLQS